MQPASDSETTEIAAAFQQWGMQTILHAMSLKAAADGSPLDDQASLTAASIKADKTTAWLWDEAVRESHDESPLMRFTEKVLDWTWHHRNSTATTSGPRER